MQWWVELGCCPIGHLTGEHDPNRHGIAAMPRAIENEDAQSRVKSPPVPHRRLDFVIGQAC
jgi:hypothetical protein